MTRSKKSPTKGTALANEPAPTVSPKRLAEIHPVLREAVRDIRQANEHLGRRPVDVEGVVALLDTLVRTLVQRRLVVSAALRKVTVRQGDLSIGLGVAERVKRFHKNRASDFLSAVFDQGQERRSDGLYYYKEGRKAGQPVYVFESTGVLSLYTTPHVPWGRNLTPQAVKWEFQAEETDEGLVARVADEVPQIFECMVRFRERKIERGRIEEEHMVREADQRARVEAAREAEHRRRGRVEGQTAFVDKVITQAAKAREIRQFLAEAPTPQEGQDGYGRMRAYLAERLAALEWEIGPEAVEAAAKAHGFFTPADEQC